MCRHADRTRRFCYVFDVEVIALFVVTGGIFVAAIARPALAKRRRTTALDQIASYLGGLHGGASATGKSQGVAVTFSFATRGGGSSSESWTEIDVEVPRGYPLTLHLRRHAWRDKAHIASGDMVDVELGDPAFDQAFLIEGAPADVVRQLFDLETRNVLAAHKRVELDTLDEGGHRRLRLAIRGWLEDPAIAKASIDAVARIAAAVRDAHAELESSTSMSAQGSPYRPMLDDRPARDRAAAHADEVACVEGARGERLERRRRLTLILVLLFAAFCILLSVYGNNG